MNFDPDFEAPSPLRDAFGHPADRIRDEREDEIRQERIARAEQRAAAASRRPRSQWSTDMLTDYFRAEALKLPLARIPHHLDRNHLNIGFAELQKKGHRPQHLADATNWWTQATQRQVPSWKIFRKWVPDVANRLTDFESRLLR